MANDVEKILLSGSTDGKPILITATGSPGTTIHTATSSTTTVKDEIWLWFSNTSASDVLVTVQWGGTTSPDQSIVYTVLAQDGLKAVAPGLILQNSLVVKAFAATGSVVNVTGFVNRITHS